MSIAWSFSRLKKFETCPRQYYDVMVAKNWKESENEHTRYGKKVHKALERRVMYGDTLPLELSYLEPMAKQFADASGTKYAEQQLAIDRNFKPTDWFAPDVYCRAILDLAIVNGSSAVIVDYKTGNRIDDDFTQLKLATALFMIHVKEVEVANILFYWTKHKKPTYQKVQKNEVKTIIAELLPRVKKMETAHEEERFPPKPSGLCKRWCVVEDCPYYGT